MKRTLAFLLCLVMLFALAACGETGTAVTDDSETATVADPAETDGGWHGELPLVPEGEEKTLTIGVNTSTKVLDYKTNAYTKWIEEQTGVHLEFVQFAGTSKDAATQVSLMMAAGEKLPDILYKFSGINKISGEEFGMDGYFLDLKPYFDRGFNYHQKQSMQTLFGDDANHVYHTLMDYGVEPTTGGIYSFPTMEEVPLDTPVYHAWINQQWLDNLGLTAPTNVDELYDVLVAFRDNDPNGNGKKDEIPMTGKANSAYKDIIAYIINAYIFWNRNYHFNVTDGQLWIPYDTDEYRQALCFVNKLVKEGLISEMTWTQSAAELKSLINGTDGTYTCGIICDHADVGFEVGNDSIYQYVPLHPLADATGRGGMCPKQSYTQHYTTYITADCADPELAFKFLDFTMSQESYMRQRWGEYGVDWEWSDGTKPGNMGGTANFRKIKPDVWGTENNCCWHAVNSVASEKYYQFEVDFSDLTDWNNVRAMKLLQNYENAMDAGEPDELFTYVSYTADEYEARSEVEADIVEYLKTARTNFCNGILDPNSDADWNDYLANLKSLGVYDPWMSTAQSAYTRSLQY